MSRVGIALTVFLGFVSAACVPTDPGQTGQLGLMSTVDIHARFVPCPEQVGRAIEHIELVKHEGHEEEVIWRVSGNAGITGSPIDFVVGSPSVGSLSGDGLSGASLDPNQKYVLIIDLVDSPIVLNEFRPGDLKNDAWLTWQGKMKTGDLTATGCR